MDDSENNNNSQTGFDKRDFTDTSPLQNLNPISNTAGIQAGSGNTCVQGHPQGFSTISMDGYPVSRISLSPSSTLGQNRRQHDTHQWDSSATVTSHTTGIPPSTYHFPPYFTPTSATGLRSHSQLAYSQLAYSQQGPQPRPEITTAAMTPGLTSEVNKQITEIVDSRFADFKEDLKKNLSEWMNPKKRSGDITSQQPSKKLKMNKKGEFSGNVMQPKRTSTVGRKDHDLSSTDSEEGEEGAEASGHWSSSEQSEDEEGQLSKDQISSSDEDIDMCMETDIKGPKIADQIAKSIDKHLTNRLEKAKIKKLLNSLHPPENCLELKVPKTNKILYDKIPGFAKKKDKEFQKVQKDLICSLSAAAQLKTLLIEAKESKTLINMRKCTKLTSKILKTNIASMQNINRVRRYNVKNSLPHDMTPLCAVPEQGSSQEYLFGDTSAKLEEVNKHNKLLKKLSATTPSKPAHHSEYKQPQHSSSGYGRSYYPKPKNLQGIHDYPNPGSHNNKWGSQQQKYKNQRYQKRGGRGYHNK